MANLEVNITTFKKQMIYGLWGNSSDKTISEDIKALSANYKSIISSQKTILPFYILSRNYDEQSCKFDIFVGGTVKQKELESFTIPDGHYAKITVKPKFGVLWGLSIGQAKRYFYTKWLPQKPYRALNMEFEYHTEKSIGKSPSIDILFELEKK